MDVVVVGSCNIDTFMYLDGNLPRAGETVHGLKLETDFGGKGANQAVMATRLRVRTALVAKLGSYLLGHNYLLQLQAEGVETAHVTKTAANTMTGSAYITVDKQGQNTVVVIPGANACLSPDDILAAKKLVLEAGIVIFQLETPLDTSLFAMDLIHREYQTRRPLVLLNPAPCEQILPDRISDLVDIIVANEPETECLTGVHIADGQDVDFESSVHAALKALLNKARFAVVVTLGNRGCALGYRDRSQQVENVVLKIFTGVKVQAVDTVGAGDAFVGSFASFVARGAHVEDACLLANKIAAITVAVKGAQASFPTLEAVGDEDISSALAAPDCVERNEQFSKRS